MYGKIFLTFFKIGLFTFGGGHAMIPLIHRDVIDTNEWIKESEFIHIIAIAESTPGPIAVNTATYVGYKTKGVLGSAVATLGVILPSFIIISLISLILMEFKENIYVEYAFKGIRVAVSMLIFNAALRIYGHIKSDWFSYLMMATGFGLIMFRVIPVVLVFLIGGLSGIVHAILTQEGGMRQHD
jgi:chromate transporter